LGGTQNFVDALLEVEFVDALLEVELDARIAPISSSGST
jgi:hypothetical protein